MAITRGGSNNFNKSNSDSLLEEKSDEDENNISYLLEIPELSNTESPQSVFATKKSKKSDSRWNWIKKSIFKLPKLLLAAIPAISSSANAAAGATNSDTKNIGKEWWNNMTTFEKFFSVWNALTSLLVNVKVNIDYLPVAFEKTKTSIFTSFKSKKKFISNISIMTIGISAAIAAGAIAYESFVWAGPWVASSITGVNSIIFYATRYVGLKNLMNRLMGLFNKDIQFSKKMINALERIDKDQLLLVNKIISDQAANHKKGLSDTHAMTDIFIQLDKLSMDLNLNGEKLIQNKTKNDVIKEYSGIVFDLFISAVTAIFIFPTFAQKGFDGIKQLSKLLGNDISNLNNAMQISIGFLPGAASAAMYAMSALDFRQIALFVFQELKNQPKEKVPQILSVLLSVTANYFACTGMENIARKGILDRESKEQLIHFITKNSTREIYVKLNRMGAFFVNTKSCLADCYGSKADVVGLIKQLRKWDIDNIQKPEINQVLITAKRLGVFGELIPIENRVSSHNDYQLLPESKI